MNQTLEDVLGSPPELATRAWLRHTGGLWTDSGVLFAGQGKIGFIKSSDLRSATATPVFLADRANTRITWGRGILHSRLRISTPSRTFKFSFLPGKYDFKPDFYFVEFADASIGPLSSFFAEESEPLAIPFSLIHGWREDRKWRARLNAWREYLSQ